MSKTLMIKAMVLGAVACAFSFTGFAATVKTKNSVHSSYADKQAMFMPAKAKTYRPA